MDEISYTNLAKLDIDPKPKDIVRVFMLFEGFEEEPMKAEHEQYIVKKRNIDTRPVFPAISQYPFWPVKQKSQPVAHQVATQSLNLPSGVCLKREQVDYICRNIKEILSSVK